MPKYGRGLGKEIFFAAMDGRITQPLEFSKSKGWDVPENYIKVVLANSEVDRKHSPTYKNYFIRVSEGKYRVRTK
jgi:hypothetical protein